MTKTPNLAPPFLKESGDFLEIGIWILFVICILVLVIFDFQYSSYLKIQYYYSMISLLFAISGVNTFKAIFSNSSSRAPVRLKHWS